MVAKITIATIAVATSSFVTGMTTGFAETALRFLPSVANVMGATVAVMGLTFVSA